MLPTLPNLPWDIGAKKMKPEKIYAYDALTIPVNLAEACAISMPAGTINKIPIGLQIICAREQDSLLISLSKKVETTSQLNL